jgi:hypothetical protein
MTKQYVEDGSHVEATSVDFTVVNQGTALNEAQLTCAADLKVWDDSAEEWREVKWDFSVKPARLYYFT